MAERKSHVVLLPQGAGWEWYEALSDYLRRFRPTVTQSADDAVGFRGDLHTITVINPASWNKPGVARQPSQPDDIIVWLNDPKNAGAVKFEIDPVPAADPGALKKMLADRVLASLRYGKRATATTSQPMTASPQPPANPEQQKLGLVWPSDFKVYTQKFGQRPEFYSKFGLPGHEGVDIRAPTGTNVYAVADGTVTQVGWKRPDHPYGYSVRLRHKRADGEYESIYAHLTDGSTKVNEGDAVKSGQLIALADNTGNSSAAHLHYSLKKIGAKNGGFGELIDPEPFFVDPPK